MAVRNRGTTIIANGLYGTKNHIDYIERTFPDLKKFQKKDATRCFCVKEREKYYLCVGKPSGKDSIASFTNAIAFGCDYGSLCDNRKAMVVYGELPRACPKKRSWLLCKTRCALQDGHAPSIPCYGVTFKQP